MSRHLPLPIAVALSIVAAGSAVAQGASTESAVTTPQTKDWKVIGGMPAQPFGSPWQVALMDREQPLVFGPVCGGTAIGDKWVLTAAHCFYDIATCKMRFTVARIWVLHGTTDLATTTPRLAGVQKIHLPPTGFDCKNFAGDIALVELRDLLPAGTRMQLPTAQQDAALEMTQGRFSATGWGYTSESGSISQILMEVSVPPVPMAQCKAMLEPGLPVPERTLCAGEFGKDTCRGDSGGPLFKRVPGSPAQAVQFGITSFGSGCGRPDKPGVYTRVAAYGDWIRKTMAAPTCTPALAAAGKC